MNKQQAVPSQSTNRLAMPAQTARADMAVAHSPGFGPRRSTTTPPWPQADERRACHFRSSCRSLVARSYPKTGAGGASPVSRPEVYDSPSPPNIERMRSM
jgi:hypothetical protein